MAHTYGVYRNANGQEVTITESSLSIPAFGYTEDMTTAAWNPEARTLTSANGAFVRVFSEDFTTLDIAGSGLSTFIYQVPVAHTHGVYRRADGEAITITESSITIPAFGWTEDVTTAVWDGVARTSTSTAPVAGYVRTFSADFREVSVAGSVWYKVTGPSHNNVHGFMRV